jgi:hypothetical protein
MEMRLKFRQLNFDSPNQLYVPESAGLDVSGNNLHDQPIPTAGIGFKPRYTYRSHHCE